MSVAADPLPTPIPFGAQMAEPTLREQSHRFAAQTNHRGDGAAIRGGLVEDPDRTSARRNPGPDLPGRLRPLNSTAGKVKSSDEDTLNLPWAEATSAVSLGDFEVPVA